MSITVYSDVILPNSVLAAGARGKQLRNNSRTMTQSGRTQINVNWASTLRQYEFGFVPLTVAQWQTIEGLHEVTEGGAYGFLLQDPKDNSTGSDGVLGYVSASVFQLQKRYTAAGSSRTKLRSITRPLASSVQITVSGTPTSYTLNSTTGVVNIPGNPSVGTLAWSGSFYVPVHFSQDEIDWELAVAGPAASRLMAGPMVTLMEVRE
jgi:uncharacterized protein (TIGR02217 family)